MNPVIIDNSIDNHVDDEILDCLKLESPKSFFLFAGAGSGKTRTLVNVLSRFKKNYGKQLRFNRQKVAIITYTNAACDEIIDRLEYDTIFAVSTIHSFAWELIKNFNNDIKAWLRVDLLETITELEEQQGKSRDLQNKSSIDRAKRIESKHKRLNNLDAITQFTYNPNGDNTSKDSLNHSEVISIAASFIKNKPLMQDLLICKYPVLLIDESQDTKKELIEALFAVQLKKKESLILGLFGDTMQRIYSDGKENIEKDLPEDWFKPAKKMNHRSNKRIISLINDIRASVDDQKQVPRIEKEDGFVRLFIIQRSAVEKQATEITVAQKMSQLTSDKLWNNESGDTNIKTLILEHHMAARRMGFLEFFEPLYKNDKLNTGLLDGSLPGIGLFTKMIIPLINAKKNNDDFLIARIVKNNSIFFKKDEIQKNTDQIECVKKSREALLNFFSLWNDDKDPLLIDVLQNIYNSGLFPIPENLQPIASRTKSEQNTANNEENLIDIEDKGDDVINTWDLALSNPFSQVQKYNDYLSEDSKFGTHQGVKGLEYPRVMVILDDEESRGFLFSYDKLFGSKELSSGDKKSISEGKETGIDRTRRLFYVACSRAKESLAIVAYTDNTEIVKNNALQFGWFKEDEIEII
jgi:DNA helicase-2/ATP-dependent DNA helicase PcrA